VNVPITAGLLIPNAGTATVILWQFINQSYNVGTNYINRSGDGLPLDKLFGVYMAATASALGVSFGLAAGVKKLAHSRGMTGPGLTQVESVCVLVRVCVCGVIGEQRAESREQSAESREPATSKINSENTRNIDQLT
jgi:hypothetical protein